MREAREIPGDEKATTRAGWSLIEVTGGLVILTLSFVGLCVLFVSNERAQAFALQRSQVTHAARAIAEEIRSTPFRDVVKRFQGARRQLALVDGQADLQIFLDETADSAAAKRLGLPRDLDGDGLVKSTDVSADYQLLPIRFLVTWQSATGPETEEFYFLFAQQD